MSDLKSRLQSHPVATLKKEISSTNIKGYSKMKKAEVVALMLKNKEKFDHIKIATKKKAEPKKAEASAPAEPKKATPFKLKDDEYYLRIKDKQNKTSIIKVGKKLKEATKKFIDRREDRKNKNYNQMILFKGDKPTKALEFSA